MSFLNFLGLILMDESNRELFKRLEKRVSELEFKLEVLEDCIKYLLDNLLCHRC